MSATDPIRPGPEMTIVHASTLHAQLLEAVAQGDGPLALDLRGVDEFDSSGVQLILALRRTLATAGRVLTIQGASATVRDALATFGLGELLHAA